MSNNFYFICCYLFLFLFARTFCCVWVHCGRPKLLFSKNNSFFFYFHTENNCESVPRETHLSFQLFISWREEKNVGNIHQALSAGCAITKIRLFFFFFNPSRLDTMVKTWGTVLSAKGSSWFCGWKEWSSQWLQSTWGSKPPFLRHKGFLTIWAQGLSHRTLKVKEKMGGSLY